MLAELQYPSGNLFSDTHTVALIWDDFESILEPALLVCRIIQESGPRLRSLMISGYASMANAAVVTGRAVYRGWSKKSGEFVHRFRFRFTDTFIRRDNAWKCVASHASGLPSK